MKNKKKKGFTLVELLAVIVILAIILVIAVPQILKTINSSRLASFKSSAELLIDQGTKQYMIDQTEVANAGGDLSVVKYGGIGTKSSGADRPCTFLTELSENDYATCEMTVSNEGVATLTEFTGKGKFKGYSCTGTKHNVTCNGEGNSGGTSGGVSTQTAAEVISAKYNDGTNSEGLILVNTNEYRYSGATVKNYVNFNNETWRIVGIFNGRIKLMRDEILGNTKWDSTAPYSNAWEGSNIEIGLNGDYLTSTGYLGLSLSSASQNLIDDNAIWYVTPIGISQTTSEAYAAERPSTGAITYEGTVGLIYPSDFGYASSGCYNGDIKIYQYGSESTCKETNWMNENMSGIYWWTTSPYSSSTNSVLVVNWNGAVQGYSGNESNYSVRPSVYLKSGVKLSSTSGDGSSASNAYVFEI